ncbi:MAG: hypothetical protein O2943_05550 [Actinomycetota bacterium]|nr:hypothetical protein [Actinomycetota bacterium]
MSDENLNELLARRAPKKRSKFTTTLIVLLILLIGVFIGLALGKGSPEAAPRGPVTSTATGHVTLAADGGKMVTRT